ncbi:hypothetical protein Acr_00g0082540 [Actinidia rufa]|uniref:Uncharacterized protein n=1 Tax=Actinidia rufa TaxID=165716 RepID=A0A7J0DWF3_9ERIC|nr:hypothetical protein Acr_00g0082540 [Actinidia rufa]
MASIPQVNVNPEGRVPSFVDAVRGEMRANSLYPPIVHVQDEGNDWLLRSAIAILPTIRSVESIKELFISENVFDNQDRALGDLKKRVTLLSFITGLRKLNQGDLKK